MLLQQFFVFIAEWYFIVWTHHSLFIHSPLIDIWVVSSNSIPRYLPRRNESICPQKDNNRLLPLLILYSPFSM